MSLNPDEALTVGRQIRVTGRVQGVFFRGWTKQQADALGVTGWVRNRSDGSVDAQLSGDAPAVLQQIERMRRGPPGAHVTRLDADETAPEYRDGFTILSD